MASIQEEIVREISKSMVELKLGEVKKCVEEALRAGIPPQLLVKEGLGTAMETVGDRFARGEYFLSELIVAGHIMNEAVDLIEPRLKAEERASVGKIVIASVEGDLHDIGKNIVVSLLKSAGFKVIDLGVDVPAEEIVRRAEETNADIVALSALLSVVVPYMERTVKAIKESEMGHRIKILVGGRVVNPEKARMMGADAYGQDAWDGVRKAKEIMEAISG